MIALAWEWLLDPAHWQGPGGVPTRVLQHLGLVGATILIAGTIALAAGFYIGHTRRGRGLVVGLSGALRAMPTLGLLVFLAVQFGFGVRLAIIPTLIVLVVLAIPPILAGAYAGIESVAPATVDASRALGLTEWQILWRVEFPLALPLIFGGLRSAVLQVVATATVAAYISLGGLGRYLFDALPVQDYPQMLAGAILVAALALLLDLFLILISRAVLPAGVRVTRAPLQKKQPTERTS
ncbi:ABC transporter permease [Mycetocola spongiae]|uniref:ABC transporter permease n=1 Tax=Mycetocola spongiae TaxID=2859226 RepID=UPI001CF3E0D5|nr:ABC transporter permease [Mycetocola spongiae]UCR88398.1 ABC transporter permease [Mycetocola spongiae]